MTNWKKAFKEEFGIHFKGSSGELKFALEFIRKEKELSYNQGALDAFEQSEKILKKFKELYL